MNHLADLNDPGTYQFCLLQIAAIFYEKHQRCRFLPYLAGTKELSDQLPRD
jgi:hypothetical protein